MNDYPGVGHPWADFLNARARVLAQWRDEGKSTDQMVDDLRMDADQVRLILMTVDKHPATYSSRLRPRRP